MQPVYGPEDLAKLDADSPAFICAQVQDDWWYRVWLHRPPHLLTLPPPCQPWSTAGRSGGLDAVDGRLPLLLAKVLKATRVPLCVLTSRGPRFPGPQA